MLPHGFGGGLAAADRQQLLVCQAAGFSHGPAPPRAGRLGWLAILAAVLSALLYVNALDNPFVYDDFRTVLNNPSIEDVWAVRTIVYREMTRPVVNFSYAVDRAIWGDGVFGYHLTSILLHALNVLLLFQLARATVDDVGSTQVAATVIQAEGNRVELAAETRVQFVDAASPVAMSAARVKRATVR